MINGMTRPVLVELNLEIFEKFKSGIFFLEENDNKITHNF